MGEDESDLAGEDLNQNLGNQKCSAKTIWRLCKPFKIRELAFQTVEDELWFLHPTQE